MPTLSTASCWEMSTIWPLPVLRRARSANRVPTAAFSALVRSASPPAGARGARSGSPTLGSVPLVAGGRDRDGVWVAVSNEGGPLDAEAAGLLFGAFTQGDAGPTRSQEGLGMGLYVVRRLVDVYGGWVSVRSDGGWVTVEVRLQPVVVPLPRTALDEAAGDQTPAPTSRPMR